MSAGAYLRVLRDREGMTRDQLADVLGVSDVTIWSIEDGRQEPKGGLLVAFIEAVKGCYDDIRRIVMEPDMTTDDARRLAEDRIRLREQSPVDVLRSEIGDDRAARAAAFLAQNPQLIEGLIQMGYALSPEADDRSRAGSQSSSVPRSSAQS